MARHDSDWWEDELARFLNDMGLRNFRCPERRTYRTFKPDAPSGRDLQFDNMAVAGHTCLVGEITDSAHHLQDKYDRWEANVNFLGGVNDRQKFRHFSSIPAQVRSNFASTTECHGFMVMTSWRVFRNAVTSRPGFHVFTRSDWELLRRYSKCLSHWARFPFLSKLGFSNDEIPPPDPGVGHAGPKKLRRSQYLKLSGRRVSGLPDLCDIYIFKENPSFLLTVAEVIRDDRIPSVVADPAEPMRKGGYQRIILQEKIAALKEVIARHGARFSFPNSIVAVLGPDCKVDTDANGEFLKIPGSYGALEIVDGQHRLYSYAHPDVPPAVRRNAEIVVTALHFKTRDAEKMRRAAATTFFDINMNHTRVRPSHLWRVGFTLLGRTDDNNSLAFKALSDCNDQAPLRNLLQINETDRGNVVRVGTLVPAIAGIFERIEGEDEFRAHAASLGSASEADLRHADPMERAKVRIACITKLVSVLFKKVRIALPMDWADRDGVTTNIYSATFFAALVRLLGDFVMEFDTWQDVEAEVTGLVANVSSYLHVDRAATIVFDRGKSPQRVPRRGCAVSVIYNYLRGARRSPHQLGRFLKPSTV